jgi:hypothetical protein
MKIILIKSPKHGEFNVLVDDKDYEWLVKFHWCIRKVKKAFYATRNEWSNNKAKKIDMHRLLMNFPDDIVDHIDGNTLNNQRSNLRLATPGQSQYNRNKQHNNKTGYRGVYFYKAYNKYSVNIWAKGKQYFGGYFTDVIDAAKKYNELAKKHHGEFANLNKIPHE